MWLDLVRFGQLIGRLVAMYSGGTENPQELNRVIRSVKVEKQSFDSENEGRYVGARN